MIKFLILNVLIVGNIRSLGCVLYEMMSLKQAFPKLPVSGIDDPQRILDIVTHLVLQQNDSIFIPILLK